jgi:hypothetical protein
VVEHISPVLILPVYKGGLLFRRCLASITPCQDLFSKICISLNGADNQFDVQSVCNAGLLSEKLLLLRTCRDLPPAVHLSWLSSKLSREFTHDNQVMLLAHDDELIEEPLRNWFRLRNMYNSNVAWIGDYETFSADTNKLSDDTASRPVTCAEYQTPLSLVDWLEHNENSPNKHVWTNMSGICVPFIVFLDLTRYWRWTFARVGARFEYMLVSHRAVQGILGVQQPVVRIHLHSGQAGRNVPPIEYLRDELRYCTWLLLNCKTKEDFFWITKSSWGVKRIVITFIYLLSSPVRRFVRFIYPRI